LLKINRDNKDLFSLKYPNEIKKLYEYIIVSLNNRVLYLNERIDKMIFATDFSFNKNLLDLDNRVKNRIKELDNYIVSVYEIDKFISDLVIFDNKNLFKLINKFNEVINSEFIVYLEKNQVLDNFYTLKYDTRFPGKMLDDVIEFEDENYI